MISYTLLAAGNQNTNIVRFSGDYGSDNTCDCCTYLRVSIHPLVTEIMKLFVSSNQNTPRAVHSHEKNTRMFATG